MSSISIPFSPTSDQVFSFSPTINGVQYQATIPWNIASSRYYLNLTDLTGTLIIFTAVASSGPRFIVTLTWANGFAMATCNQNHNIPIGSCANLRVSETGTGFDGDWQVFATTATSFWYTAPNPEADGPLTGTAQQPVNLVAGVLPGWLLFHYDTMTFEYEAA